jgi:hypothetical protein
VNEVLRITRSKILDRERRPNWRAISGSVLTLPEGEPGGVFGITSWRLLG